MPSIAAGVRANRAFLSRAVRFLAGEADVRQFLDIGTGLPAAGRFSGYLTAEQVQCPAGRNTPRDIDSGQLLGDFLWLPGVSGRLVAYLDSAGRNFLHRPCPWFYAPVRRCATSRSLRERVSSELSGTGFGGRGDCDPVRSHRRNVRLGPSISADRGCDHRN